MTALPQPFDESFLAMPHAVYSKLRDEAAVHRVTLPDGADVWLVMRDQDVRAGLADARLSVNKAHSTGGYQGFALPPALDANLLNLDHDDHIRLRRLVAQGFTPAGPRRCAPVSRRSPTGSPTVSHSGWRATGWPIWCGSSPPSCR